MSLPHKILSSCFAEHHCWQQIDLCRFTSLRSRTSTGSRKIGGCGPGFMGFGTDTARHIDRVHCHDRNQCCIPSGKAVLAKQPISLDGYAVLSNNLTQAAHVTKVRRAYANPCLHEKCIRQTSHNESIHIVLPADLAPLDDWCAIHYGSNSVDRMNLSSCTL